MEKLPLGQIISVANALKHQTIDVILSKWNSICEPEKRIWRNISENIDAVFDKPSDMLSAIKAEKYSFSDIYLAKLTREGQRYSFCYLFQRDSSPFNANALAKYLIEHGDSDCPIDRTLLKLDLAKWISRSDLDQIEVEKGIYYLESNDMKFDPLMENWYDLRQDILWAIEKNKK